jgi:hypothetical protein
MTPVPSGSVVFKRANEFQTYVTGNRWPEKGKFWGVNAGPGRIGTRLAKAAAAAKAEAKARDVPAVDLDLEPYAPTVVEQNVIDLTAGDDDDEGQDVVELGLESGRVMRVHPGGLVIRHDRFADINPFERGLAREIVPGDTIVVPDQAFVQEARTLLPVRILAHTRVQVYHAAVEAGLTTLPGAERAVRAGLELIKAVGGLRVSAPLQTRVGIATGLVVVGDLIGSGEAQERSIAGETPNLAARLQGMAESGAWPGRAAMPPASSPRNPRWEASGWSC